MKVLVTGGAGFIGSAVIRNILSSTTHSVVNVDILTYAGNLDSLIDVRNSSNYYFENIDIRDEGSIKKILNSHKPNLVMHLAAESHVDRSIDGPANFITTNINGTFSLLEATRSYFEELTEVEQRQFRFHHISTDEVYGDLAGTDNFFTEHTPYSPSSPYSSSKAASDLSQTLSLPTLTSGLSEYFKITFLKPKSL